MRVNNQLVVSTLKLSLPAFLFVSALVAAPIAGRCAAHPHVPAGLNAFSGLEACGLAANQVDAHVAPWTAHFTASRLSVSSTNRGELFPDLASFRLEGKLPEMKGKVVLVDFWASWCIPCRQSFKTLNDLQKRFGPEGLVIIAINVDEDPKHMSRFLTRNSADFTVVRDASQKLVTALDVKAMPTSFLVDRDGKLRHIHSGYHEDETPKQYEQEVAGLLNPSAVTP